MLFDLDGTLLDLDMDKFLPVYLERLRLRVAPDHAAAAFSAVTVEAAAACAADDDPDLTNEQVFWRVLTAKTGLTPTATAGTLHQFYVEDLPQLQSLARRVPAAAAVVAAVRRLGVKVVLATNPIFPAAAIHGRLQWAGLVPEQFDLLTTMENMHACKPNPAYYLEICRHIDVPPDRAIMVGNDPVLDIRAAAEAGLYTYFVHGPASPGRFEHALAELLATSSAPAADAEGELSAVPGFVRRLISEFP